MERHVNWETTPATQLAFVRFAWIFGAGLAIAMTFPQVLFAATISSVLGFGAGIMATVALFARDSVWSEDLTRWDVAAALYGSSLFASFFVDHDALRAYLEVRHALG